MTSNCFSQTTGKETVQTLQVFLQEHALPLWSTEGWDRVKGGFVEQLNPDGTADFLAHRRVRVQARQIYCFARAAMLGWYSQGREIALAGLEYLLKKAKSPDGQPGFVHVIDRNGIAVDPLRDTYDHAFILLALATTYHLTGDASIRNEIISLTSFIDHDLRSEQYGMIEGIPAKLPRRQNPHMHMLEAMIATFDATADSTYRDRADDLFRLFTTRLYISEQHILAEFFNEDWSRLEPVIVEPGHQAEWVWLLNGFERISGRSTEPYRTQLLASALRYRDSSGCLADEGDAAGRIRKFTRRLWPQTEIVKAWLAQFETGDQHAAEQAVQALKRLDQNYLRHPVRGGWYDQFDANNQSLVGFIPASSFYHIICAIAEADRVLV
jgi:mannose-6-phosphate isomerase